MKIKLCTLSISLLLWTACGPATDANNMKLANSNTNASPQQQTLSIVDRPQKIKDLMAARGDQEAAMPTLKIISPAMNSALASSTVKLKLELAGDLKGYKPGMDEATHTGNHVHVILDNLDP